MVPSAFQLAAFGVGAIALAALIPAVILQVLFEHTDLQTPANIFLAVVILTILGSIIVGVGSIGVAALGIAF